MPAATGVAAEQPLKSATVSPSLVDVVRMPVPGATKSSVVPVPENDARLSDDVVAPSAATDSWSWDGRDVSERVLPGGTYTVRIRPAGSDGDLGTGCVRTVDLLAPGDP